MSASGGSAIPAALMTLAKEDEVKDIELKVRELIRDHLGLADLPERSDNLRDDCGADSLDSVELCLAMENELDIEIEDEELERLETVGEWVDLVAAKVKEAA